MKKKQTHSTRNKLAGRIEQLAREQPDAKKARLMAWLGRVPTDIEERVFFYKTAKKLFQKTPDATHEQQMMRCAGYLCEIFLDAVDKPDIATLDTIREAAKTLHSCMEADDPIRLRILATKARGMKALPLKESAQFFGYKGDDLSPLRRMMIRLGYPPATVKTGRPKGRKNSDVK